MNQNQLDMLKENFSIHNAGKPFENFYCPIQLKETDEDLCDGHVISRGFGNSNQTIIQVGNVDHFFGSTVEAKFISGAAATATADENIMRDGGQHVKTNILVDGKRVAHYAADKKKTKDRVQASESQSIVSINDADGRTYSIGIDLSEVEIAKLIESGAKFEMESSCDFSAEAVGTILHSAHLTMFSIMKYKYVFSSGGMEMARLLDTFYQANKSIKKNPQLVAQNNQKYFFPLENRVRTLAGNATEYFQGTIIDNFFVAWVSSSSRYIAFGIFVKTGDILHIVWMYGGDAECAAEFVSLDDEHPQEMRIKVMRFHEVSEHEVKVAVDPELRTWKWIEKDERPTF